MEDSGLTIFWDPNNVLLFLHLTNALTIWRTQEGIWTCSSRPGWRKSKVRGTRKRRHNEDDDDN